MFTGSLILYCAIGAVGAWVCLMSWREGATAKAKVYRPERCYMRGPSPKWRERHASSRNSDIR